MVAPSLDCNTPTSPWDIGRDCNLSALAQPSFCACSINHFSACKNIAKKKKKNVHVSTFKIPNSYVIPETLLPSSCYHLNLNHEVLQ